MNNKKTRKAKVFYYYSGDGGEDVALKVNSRSFNLHRDYSNSLSRAVTVKKCTEKRDARAGL